MNFANILGAVSVDVPQPQRQVRETLLVRHIKDDKDGIKAVIRAVVESPKLFNIRIIEELFKRAEKSIGKKECGVLRYR